MSTRINQRPVRLSRALGHPAACERSALHAVGVQKPGRARKHAQGRSERGCALCAGDGPMAATAAPGRPHLLHADVLALAALFCFEVRCHKQDVAPYDVVVKEDLQETLRLLLPLVVDEGIACSSSSRANKQYCLV